MRKNLKEKKSGNSKRSPTNYGTNGAQFKPTELESALLAAYDLMTRVLLQDVMVTDKMTAKCIKENLWLKGDGVDFVIAKKAISDSIKKTLEEWTKEKITDKGFTYKVGKVPVRFKFLEEVPDKYNPRIADVKPYGAEFYRVPNPL